MHEIQFKEDEGEEEGGGKSVICEVIVLFFRLMLVLGVFLLSLGVLRIFWC